MVTIEKILSLPVFEGSVCAAGMKGEDRRVRYIDIAEVPDIRFWVSPDVFFLTTAYALHGEEAAFMDFLRSLVRNGAAGLGVKLGRFLDRLPDEFYAYADENDFPIVLLPSELRYSHAIRAAMEAILEDEREDPPFGGVLDDCLEEALFGDFPMRSLLHFEKAGFPLDTQVRVVLIVLRDARADMGVSALRSLMRGAGLFAAVRTSSETIVLMSRADEVSEALSDSLSLLAGGARIAMGGFHRLKDFRKSYEEAQWVLGLFGLLGLDEGLHAFEDMELFVPLLRNRAPEGVHRSALRLLAPLMDYDSRHDAELINTLHAFILCDRNHKEAARTLHLHRNTLRYRLGKIESLLPPGSLSGFPFLRLSLALLIHLSK